MEKRNIGEKSEILLRVFMLENNEEVHGTSIVIILSQHCTLSNFFNFCFFFFFNFGWFFSFIYMFLICGDEGDLLAWGPQICVCFLNYLENINLFLIVIILIIIII